MRRIGFLQAPKVCDLTNPAPCDIISLGRCALTTVPVQLIVIRLQTVRAVLYEKSMNVLSQHWMVAYAKNGGLDPTGTKQQLVDRLCAAREERDKQVCRLVRQRDRGWGNLQYGRQHVA